MGIIIRSGSVVEIATGLGTIMISVDIKAAPLTASNFIKHVRLGLLDSTSFYRVAAPINQQMENIRINVIQGGLKEDDAPLLPPIPHEPTCLTGLRHLNGTVSMARRELGSASGSFFICIGDQPQLDHGGFRHQDGAGFAAFGHVVSGMPIVRRIWANAEAELMLKRPVPIFSVSLLVEQDVR